MWHDGQREGYSIPTTNITIRDMTCRTGAGCLAIGSEMSGGVEGVHASDVTCARVGWGLNVKSALGRGGYIRDVRFENATLGSVAYVGLMAGDTYTDRFPPAPVNATLVPIIDGITIRIVTAVGPAGSITQLGAFQGLGGVGNVTAVTMADVNLSAGAGSKGWHAVQQRHGHGDE